MADEIDQVHEEALRVLHEKTGQSAVTPASAATPKTALPAARATSGEETRAEREARLKAEAQQRMAEREKQQELKRQQFEQYVKDREQLRQQQRAHDENVARQTGQIKNSSSADDVHARALDVLHQLQAQPAAAPVVSQPALEPASNPAPAPAPKPAPTAVPAAAPRAAVAAPSAAASPRVSEAEVAPRVTASSGNTLVAQNTDDVHQKALEVLRQQTQVGSAPATQNVTPATSSTTASPGPSPELQQRLKAMQAELENAQPQARSASPAFSDAYVKELEQRALQNAQTAQQPGAVSATPAATAPLDNKAREILRRQDAEIANKTSAPVAARTSTGQVYSKTGLRPDEEAQAREVLRQQTAGATSQPVTTTAPVAVAPAPVVAAPTTAAATPVTSPDSTSVQYSKELEDRAREIIRQRAQTQQSGVSQPAPAPAAIAPSAQPAGQANNISAAPATTPSVSTFTTSPASTDATTENLHNQALETLGQIQPGEGARTMPKTRDQRLRDLTDMYRADKIGPAEYHQRRAQILAEPK